MARSLRFWLALGLSTLIGGAIAIFAATLLGVLLPRLNDEVESSNRQLSLAVARQVNSFLGASADMVHRVGLEIAAQADIEPARARVLADALVNAATSFEALYIVDANDKVVDVGMPVERRLNRDELIGVDFSGRSFVQASRVSRSTVWSDTYLSARGNISVAIAMPLMRQSVLGTLEPWTLVAELNLADLSQRVAELGRSADVLPVVVDRRGHIVAHPEPARGLRQESVAHLKPVQDGMLGHFEASRFVFEGQNYIGTASSINGPGWLALVAQPVEAAYATVRSTLLALGIGAAIALILALVSAVIYGRRLTARVADFSRHVQAVADGDYTAPLPHSRSEELDNLAASMRRMADAVLEREAALAASEERYRGLFRNAPLAYQSLDMSAGIIEVNDAWLNLLGYERDEVVGRPITDFIEERSLPVLADNFPKFVASGRIEGPVFDLRRKDGDRRTVMIDGRIFHGAQGEARTHCILTDITERMRVEAERSKAEKALTESEQRFRDVAAISGDWIWELDAEARFTYASDSISNLLGFRPEEVIGKTPFDFMPAGEAERVAAEFGAFAAVRLPFRDLENILVGKDGVSHITLASGSPIFDGEGRFVGYRGVDRDITERRRAEEAQRLAATVFSASAEGICITGADRRIVSVNPALSAISGYAAEEVIGKTPKVFSSGRHDAEFYRAMWERIDADGFWRGEVWDRRKNGEVFPEWLTITAVRDSAGSLTHYIGSFFDISERKRAEEDIQFLAHHDPLTKLPNRALLDDRIRQAIAKSRRNEDHTAVLFLDLDRFKLINDTLGHDIGDRLLECIADRLRSVLRETETVARLGGDEFIIVIPELGDIDHVAVVAQKVLEVIAEPQAIDGRVLHVTPSIGISVYPEDGTDAQTLLRNADTAMYHAKEHGRNNFQFFTQAMNIAVQERVSIEADLRTALERDELVLFYQPQVDCRSGRISGMEALIRWRHPERGLVPPDRFIPIAEETGLIVPIGAWVLREACQQARRWHDAGQPDLVIGVNLSARQFQQADLYEQIAGALADSGIDSRTLELELTESMLMADPVAATELLQTLSGLGIRMAIDDFGTGYSSLAYLKRFPVTRLKIDRSFVRDLSTDANDAAIVRAIVAMAGSLKMDVIAEGVETVEQLRYLEQHGCHDIQGFFFSRPRPAEDFAAFSFPLPPTG